MTGQAPAGTADDAARVLIGRDVGFLIGLMTSLTNRQTAGDQGATSLLMTYLDWVSLVVYEVREVGRRGIASINLQQAINHESEIAASRHSAKLLDDTKKTVEDQLAAFRRFSARHREQLIDKTRAPFAMRIFPWLGRLQDDTGVVLCGNDVIATTLSYRFHLGLDMDSDGSIVQSRGYELGAFLGAVRDERGTTWAEQTRAADLTFPPVHAMDTKYEEFFGSTFSGLPVPESMALSIIACRLRAVLVMSDAARSAGEVPAHLSFKFRFAMTWQVASTMRTIAAKQDEFPD